MLKYKFYVKIWQIAHQQNTAPNQNKYNIGVKSFRIKTAQKFKFTFGYTCP